MVKRDSEVLRLNYSYQMSLSFKSIYIYGSVSWRKLKYINPFKQQRLWNLLNTSHIIWELCPRVKKITADTEVASPFTTAFSCCFSFFSPTHILEDLKIWAHINDHTPCFCWSVFLTSSKQFPTTFFFCFDAISSLEPFRLVLRNVSESAWMHVHGRIQAEHF